MLFKEYCILSYMLTRANQGTVINKKSSYCKDRANQGRVNQGIAVETILWESHIWYLFNTLSLVYNMRKN